MWEKKITNITVIINVIIIIITIILIIVKYYYDYFIWNGERECQKRLKIYK